MNKVYRCAQVGSQRMWRFLALLSLALTYPASIHALSPMRFGVTYVVQFDQSGVGLRASERERFFDFVATMSKEGQCAVEIVLVDGAAGNWESSDLKGIPAAERKRYLVNFLARAGLRHVYFLNPKEARTQKQDVEVRLEITGNYRQANCTVGADV